MIRDHPRQNMKLSEQVSSSKEVVELSLRRLRSLSSSHLVEGGFKQTQRFRQMGTLFDVALESCRSMNNGMLANDLLYFEPLARQHDLSAARREDLGAELEMLIAQISRMTLDELSGPPL